MLEVVRGELDLFLQPDLTVGDVALRQRIARPYDVIDRIDILQKGRNALQTIGKLRADRIQLKSAALLEIRELRDLQAVQHHLPSHSPGATGRPFPVVLFKLQIVLAQVDSYRGQRFEIDLLYALRRRLQNHLELCVLEETVRILPVASVRRTTRGLRVGNVKGTWPEYTQECLRRHGACAHFDVVGLLKHAAAGRPEGLQVE